jgi:hypothetical protein
MAVLPALEKLIGSPDEAERELAFAALRAFARITGPAGE